MLLLWTQADVLSLIGTILNGLAMGILIISWYHLFIGYLMILYVLKIERQNNDKDIYKFTYTIAFIVINTLTSLILNIFWPNDVTIGNIIGWITMSLYIIGRFPQIILNIQRHSTEGLSILMYILTIIANIFYLLSVFSYSIEYDYIMLNLPWIISTVVTILLDLFVILQCYIYKHYKTQNVTDC
jgi:uncharacterized protein with PQ loop repeat